MSGAAALATMWGEDPRVYGCGIRVLRLAQNAFGAGGVRALMAALVAGRHNVRQAALEVLDLSDNGLGARGLKAAADGLEWVGSSVVELGLAGNGAAADGESFGLVRLVRVVESSMRRLTRLDLAGNDIGSDIAQLCLVYVCCVCVRVGASRYISFACLVPLPLAMSYDFFLVPFF